MFWRNSETTGVPKPVQFDGNAPHPASGGGAEALRPPSSLQREGRRTRGDSFRAVLVGLSSSIGFQFRSDALFKAGPDQSGPKPGEVGAPSSYFDSHSTTVGR